MEDLLDLLRVLMTGPDDTPYANECYVLDVSLDGYPQSPPKVNTLPDLQIFLHLEALFRSSGLLL